MRESYAWKPFSREVKSTNACELNRRNPSATARPSMCRAVRCGDRPLSHPLNAARSELAFNLSAGFELYGVYALALCARHVVGDVIGEETLFRTALGARDGFAIDHWRGFQGADLVREDRGVKVPQQGIGFQQHGKVNGIGVGKQQQAVAPVDALEQTFGDQWIGQEDGAPDFAKLIVGDAQIEHARKLIDGIVWLNQ